MAIFTIGIKLIIALTCIFFCFLCFLCWQWSKTHEKRERAIIAPAVSLIYSFKVFIFFLLVLLLVYLGWEYFKGVQTPPLESFPLEAF